MNLQALHFGAPLTRPGTTLSDERREALPLQHAADPLAVSAVVVGEGGAFTLRLTGDTRLDILPDASSGEQWRVICNGVKTASRHHVFTLDPEHEDWGRASSR